MRKRPILQHRGLVLKKVRQKRAAKVIGYARVSTADQTVRQQVDALEAAGCTEIYQDVTSGATTTRVGLDAALAALEDGDALIVVRLDRLGRPMPHLVSTVQQLADRGVAFRSLGEAIDTSSATGRLVLGIFASLADFERSLIAERTRAALAAKRRRCERLGRPRALDAEQLRVARDLLAGGASKAQTARVLSVDRGTLHRALAS